MASIRLGHRIPLRPNAERSPSPDYGIKSIIPHTMSPKVDKEHLASKGDKQQTINKVKDENRKLKEEMKLLISRNKETHNQQSIFREGNGSIKRGNKIDQQNHHRATEKTRKVSSIVSSVHLPSTHPSTTNLTLNEMKNELNSLMREKEDEIYEKYKQIEYRLHVAENYQRQLEERILDQKQQIQTTAKKRLQSSMKKSEQDQPIVSLYGTRPQLKHKELIRQLESQLQSARDTIYRLQRVLQIEGKQACLFHEQSAKKQSLIVQLKKEKQLLAKDLKDAYKQLDQYRQSEVTNVNDMTALKNQIQDLEKRIREHQREKEQSELLNREELEEIKEKYQREREELNRSIEVSYNELKNQEETKRTGRAKEMQGQIDRLTARLQQYTGSLKELQQEVSEKNTVIDRLNESILEKQQRYNTIVQTEQLTINEKEQLMIENNQLNIQLNEQNKEIEVLTGKLDEIVGNYNEYSEKYKKEGEHWVEEIKRVKVILEGTTFNVRKKVEKNDNRADQLALKQRQQVLSLESTIQTLKLSHSQSASQISFLEGENDSLRQKIQSLQQSIQKYCATPPSEPVVRIESVREQQIESNQKLKVQSRTMESILSRLNNLYSQVNEKGD